MSEAVKQGATAHRLVENLMALEPGETFSRTVLLEPDVRAENLREVISATRQRMSSAVSSTLAMLQYPGVKKFTRETVTGLTSGGNYAVALIITRVQ